MNVYNKIDAIFSGESEDKPAWANEILSELKEIKTLLKEQKTTINKIDKNYYEFIKSFRRSMRADVANNIYPTFNYNGRRLGVDFKGLLYDKETKRTIPKHEAFEAYRYAYEHKESLGVL